MSSKLILIRGPICSGKSTVTRLLRQKLDSASLVDFEPIKQQIDYRASSTWRRQIALHAAVYLAGELLTAGRTVIAEVHSAFPDQYDSFRQAAGAHGSPFHSFLIMAPVDVCLERARQRPVHDAWYAASESEVNSHWDQTYRIRGEPEFDTSRENVKGIVDAILRQSGCVPTAALAA